MITGRVAGSGGGGGNDFDPTGLASELWVDQNYISKDFFNRLFTIHSDVVTQDDPQGEVIEPNDVESTVASIQALVGLWAEEYLSALGQGSGGGGGGSILTEPLASINLAGLGVPSGSNKVIAWNGSSWVYMTLGSGSGTVRSITAGTGLSGGTITTSGTIAISSTYQDYISHGESAYNSLSNYLLKSAGVTAIVVGTSGNADKIGVTINGTNTGFITVPYASKAAQLYTSRSIWGQSFDGSGDVKGDIKNATCLEFSEIGGNAGHGGYIDFHYNGSTSDYTSRIIEDVSGVLKLNNTIFAKLSGNVSIGSSTIPTDYKLDVNGYTKTTRLYLDSSVYFEYDSTNGGVRLVGAGFYADNYVSALDAGSGGGSGSGITMADVWQAMAYTAPSSSSQQIHVSHLNQALTTYATKTWVNDNAVTLATNQTITAAKTMANNLTMAGSITPSTDNQYSLGTEQKRFSAVYAYRLIYVGGMTIHYLSGSGVLAGYHLSAGSADIILETSGYVWQKQASQYYSDMRQKNVISDVDLSVKQIADAPVFNFKWKDADSDMQVGSSAQYWHEHLTPATAIASNGQYGMDYGRAALISTVIVARKVMTHEERIKALEKENKELRKQIETLKAS